MTGALVFDTGPLSHFAEAGWLRLLHAVAGDREVIIPEAVRSEIAMAAHIYPFLRQILDADRIRTDRSDDVGLLVAQARYTRRMASGTRNLGECGVLALAEVRRHVAIVDDRVARQIGKEYGVEVRGTLSPLCEGIRAGLLTVKLVSEVADDLLATEYRLPVRPGRFARWAAEQGLVRRAPPCPGAVGGVRRKAAPPGEIDSSGQRQRFD